MGGRIQQSIEGVGSHRRRVTRHNTDNTNDYQKTDPRKNYESLVNKEARATQQREQNRRNQTTQSKSSWIYRNNLIRKMNKVNSLITGQARKRPRNIRWKNKTKKKATETDKRYLFEKKTAWKNKQGSQITQCQAKIYLLWRTLYLTPSIMICSRLLWSSSVMSRRFIFGINY